MTDDALRDALQALVLSGDLSAALVFARTHDFYTKRCLWCFSVGRPFADGWAGWLCEACAADANVRARIVRTTHFNDGSMLQVGPPVLFERPLAKHPRTPCTIREVPFVPDPALELPHETK